MESEDTYFVIPGMSYEEEKSFIDLVDDRIKEQVNEEKEYLPKKNFDVLPLFFENIKTWPVSSNLKCWGCGLKYNCTPKFIPYKIEDDKITVLGNTCSFCCAARWINSQKISKNEQFRLTTNLIFLAKKFGAKKRISFIPPAPSPYEMTSFGGSISKIKFRISITDLEAQIFD